MDNAPIRNKARRAYEKSRQQVDDLRQEVENHEKKDVPLFEQWYAKNFGGLLTELRSLHQEVARTNARVQLVEHFIIAEGIGPKKAYKKMEDYLNKPPEELEEESRQKQEEYDRRSEGDKEHEGQENNADFFEELFGSLFDQFNPRKRKEDESQENRLKTVYRELVRKLHPDTSKAQTPRMLEWWHQVQEAYERKDVEQLEAILSLYQMEEEKNPKNDTPVSILLRLTKQLKSTLRKLKHDLTRYRLQPAWKFSENKDLSTLLKRNGKELKDQVRVLKRKLKALNAAMESFQKNKIPRGFGSYFLMDDDDDDDLW